MYISRYYRLRPGLDYPKLDSPIMAFIGWARSMAFPADNGTFALLATIADRDPLRRRLTTEAGFHRFHSAVPLIRPWLAAGEPISPIRVMARLENSYRRLADGDGPSPAASFCSAIPVCTPTRQQGGACPSPSPRPITLR
jgi:hypothetical protein